MTKCLKCISLHYIKGSLGGINANATIKRLRTEIFNNKLVIII